MIIDLGLIDYEDAFKIQNDLVCRVIAGESRETFLLAEHPPVFTIGRSAAADNLLVSRSFLEQNGIKVLRADRGGDITFHGPGQLVVYPILDLKQSGPDLHSYIRYLESLAISLLEDYGVSAQRAPGRSGVWVGGRKIASVGVGARNWVTYHGLSVNVGVDLGYFSMIHPCGLVGVEMTSLERVLGVPVGMAEAKDRMKRAIDAAAYGFSTVA